MRKTPSNPSHIPEPWADNTYRTGSTTPPKSHNGVIALLLVLVIVLCGIITVLGITNAHLFRILAVQDEEEQELAVSFSGNRSASFYVRLGCCHPFRSSGHPRRRRAQGPSALLQPARRPLRPRDRPGSLRRPAWAADWRYYHPCGWLCHCFPGKFWPGFGKLGRRGYRHPYRVPQRRFLYP